MKTSFRTSVILLITFFLAGCATLMSGFELGKADQLFQEKKYTEALHSYQEVVSHAYLDSQRAEARYSIALVLSSPDNPKKNYHQALEVFEEYIRLYPKSERIPEANNWKNTLKLLLEQARENDQLRKNIEELKRLDIRHEEKRKRR